MIVVVSCDECDHKDIPFGSIEAASEWIEKHTLGAAHTRYSWRAGGRIA